MDFYQSRSLATLSFFCIQVGQNSDNPYTGSNYDLGATVRILFLSFQCQVLTFFLLFCEFLTC